MEILAQRNPLVLTDRVLVLVELEKVGTMYFNQERVYSVNLHFKPKLTSMGAVRQMRVVRNDPVHSVFSCKTFY